MVIEDWKKKKKQQLTLLFFLLAMFWKLEGRSIEEQRGAGDCSTTNGEEIFCFFVLFF